MAAPASRACPAAPTGTPTASAAAVAATAARASVGDAGSRPTAASSPSSRAKTNPLRAKAPSTTSRSTANANRRAGVSSAKRTASTSSAFTTTAPVACWCRTITSFAAPIGLHRSVELEMVRPEARHDGDVRARRHEREVGARELEHDDVRTREGRSALDELVRHPQVAEATVRGGEDRPTGGSENLNGKRRSGRLSRRARKPQRSRPNLRHALEHELRRACDPRPGSAQPGHALRRFGCPHVEIRDIGGCAIGVAVRHAHIVTLRDEQPGERLRLGRRLLDHDSHAGHHRPYGLAASGISLREITEPAHADSFRAHTLQGVRFAAA